MNKNVDSIQNLLKMAKTIKEQEASDTVGKNEVTAEKKGSTVDELQGSTTELEMVGLDGIIERGDGILEKSSYFDLIRPESSQYQNIKLTTVEAKSVMNTIRRQTTGINAVVPMKCTSDACPFNRTCPYSQIGKAPIGKDCPVEGELLARWTEQYMHEFDVEMDNFTELGLIAELAECNLYERRVTMNLADKNPELISLEVTTSDMGTTETEVVAKAWDVKEKIKNRRMKILQSLMATRQDKAKLRGIEGDNSSETTAKKISDLKGKMELMLKQLEGQGSDPE